MERLEMLRGMFSKCGDGVFIMRMDNNDRFRIPRQKTATNRQGFILFRTQD